MFCDPCCVSPWEGGKEGGVAASLGVSDCLLSSWIYSTVSRRVDAQHNLPLDHRYLTARCMRLQSLLTEDLQCKRATCR